jgi:hypothetical protein
MQTLCSQHSAASRLGLQALGNCLVVPAFVAAFISYKAALVALQNCRLCPAICIEIACKQDGLASNHLWKHGFFLERVCKERPCKVKEDALGLLKLPVAHVRCHLAARQTIAVLQV